MPSLKPLLHFHSFFSFRVDVGLARDRRGFTFIHCLFNLLLLLEVVDATGKVDLFTS